jgi:hypothetical protein
MWYGRLLMISFAGLGEAFGGGETAGVGVSVGVGTVPGVVVTGEVEGLASGEFVAVWLVWVQPANSKTNPATHAAGTTRLLNTLSDTVRQQLLLMWIVNVSFPDEQLKPAPHGLWSTRTTLTIEL